MFSKTFFFFTSLEINLSAGRSKAAYIWPNRDPTQMEFTPTVLATLVKKSIGQILRCMLQ